MFIQRQLLESSNGIMNLSPCGFGDYQQNHACELQRHLQSDMRHLETVVMYSTLGTVDTFKPKYAIPPCVAKKMYCNVQPETTFLGDLPVVNLSLRPCGSHYIY